MHSFNGKPDAKAKECKNAGFYRHKHYDINKYWKPGQPVTEADLKMLVSVSRFFDEHGYTPTKDDIVNVVELKARFRTWNNVLLAAGLPDKNDPENQRKRMAAAEEKKRIGD